MNDFGQLTHFALIEVAGPDSERFLQGQLTCDVVALANQHWLLGACCNPKGRMVANFVIAKIDNSFWLRVPHDNAQALLDHLSRYIVFFKASMQLRNDWQVLGSLTGLTSPSLIKQALPLQLADQQILLNWPDGRQECWQAPSNSTLPIIDQAWTLADIQQGIAWVTETTRLEWLPQEIDWAQQGGVSFNKGCYTGQEIVARLQFLGKSKKLWVQITSETELELPLLTELSDDSGKNVGQLASRASKMGLAIIHKDLEQPELYAAQQPVRWQPLFYQTDNHE